ncbi:hypothetical protein FPV67DRAFT_875658 [Lyophyllum atratum]|nr:hypothetical protein FPV67DRAFT_875658 [Lyophyllum atratum]
MSEGLAIPQLREVPLSEVAAFKTLPGPKIKTDHDVQEWKKRRSYQDYAIFLRRLNEAVVGKSLPRASPPGQAIVKTLDLLNTLDRWIDEIPPLESPQRFGNLAFRTWGARLEERVDEILGDLLTAEYSVVIPHVKPLLLTSFGSFTRMDYGTGHETSFGLFLLALTLVRFYQPVEADETDLVLRAFVRYQEVCWKLQDTYRLEPAGSHGVWGLDDYSFLGYIFGSAQLRDQTDIPVSAVLQPDFPSRNMYFNLITRIRQVKHGPFHEHSSQLHSIAMGVPNWRKVNSGLFKMYEAEVLGKRVVVQHLPLGGLLEWDDRGSAASDSSMPPPAREAANAQTQAPWART